jgi:ribosomal protein S27AE
MLKIKNIKQIGGLNMGLFSNKKKSKNNINIEVTRKTVTCPRCGKRYTVTFLGSNDSKTCKCGYKIWNN